MTKKEQEKLPKRQDKKPEPPKPVEVPELKLIDVIREIKTLRNDLGIAIEAVKALGADVIENNNMQSAALTDLNNQMQELQRAFINVVSKGFEAPATTPKQVAISDLGNLESLKWSTKPWGQWSFATTQEGIVTQGAEKLVTALKQSEKRKLSAGGYDYRLSKDGKFIQRRKQK